MVRENKKTQILYPVTKMSRIERTDRRGRERQYLSNTPSNIRILQSQNRQYRIRDESQTITHSFYNLATTSILTGGHVYRDIQFTSLTDIYNRRRKQKILSTGFQRISQRVLNMPYSPQSKHFYLLAPKKKLVILDKDGNEIIVIENFRSYWNFWFDSQKTLLQKNMEETNSNEYYVKVMERTQPTMTQQLIETMNGPFQDSKRYDCCIYPIWNSFHTPLQPHYEEWNKKQKQHLHLKNKQNKTKEEIKQMNTAREQVRRYDLVRNASTKFLEIAREKKGLYINQIEQFADEAHITYKISSPFDNVNEVFLINKSSNFHFHFIKTSFNHLEYHRKNYDFLRLSDKTGLKENIIKHNIDTQAEMHRLLEKDTTDIYWKSNIGNISTIVMNDSTKYIFRKEDKDVEELFRDVNNIQDYRIYINPKNTFLHCFIDNLSGVAGCKDYMNITHYQERKKQGENFNVMLGQVDIEKSYYNTDKIGEYNSGVAGNLLHYGSFPKKDTPEYIKHFNHYVPLSLKENVIFFVIKDITFTNKRLEFHSKKLNFYIDNRIVRGEHIDFLLKHSTKLTITHFLMCSRIPISFPPQTLKKIPIHKGDIMKGEVPHYSKIIGNLFGISENNSHYRKGTEKDCKMFNYELDRLGSSTICKWSDYDRDIKVVQPKNIYTSLSHIASSIVQNQYLSTFQQLLQMDENKVVRVIGDGIYYIPHSFKVLKDYGFVLKEKEKHFNLNSSGGTCLSSSTIIDWSNFYIDTIFTKHLGESRRQVRQPFGDDYIIREDYSPPKPHPEPTTPPTLYYPIEIWKGQGGTGKTHTFFKEKLYEDNYDTHEFMFLTHTKSLLQEVREDYFDDDDLERGKFSQTSTRHIFSCENCTTSESKEKTLKRRKNLRLGKRVFVIDEFTNTKPKVLKDILKRFGHLYKFILIGDIEKIEDNEGESHMFNYQLGDSHSWLFKHNPLIRDFKEDYRATNCPLLQSLKLDLRKEVYNFEVENHCFDEDAPFDYNICRNRHSRPIIDFILKLKNHIKVIKIEDIGKHYNTERGDLIITGYNGLSSSNLNMRNRFIKFIKNQTHKRYKKTGCSITLTLPENEEPPKGYKECYSATCDSIQGTTIHSPSLVFIDKELFTLQHLYVALSRGNNINQYILITK